MTGQATKPTMRVRLLRGGKVVRSFIVKKDTFTIGSGKEAAVRIGGIPDLAPKHALIWLDDGTPTLVPSSGCIVLVNGGSVNHTQLGPNDTVSLGKLDLQIESLIEPNVANTPAAPPAVAAPAPQAPPPRARRPQATSPAKLQVNPSVFDDFIDDDEDATQIAAPNLDVLRTQARPTPNPVAAALPEPTFEQPTSPQPTFEQQARPQPTFEQQARPQPTFEQQARPQPTIEEQASFQPTFEPPAINQPTFAQPPAASFFGDDERTIPSRQALTSGPNDGFDLSDEERAALQDLLPFATPVPTTPTGPPPQDSAPPLNDLLRSPALLLGDQRPAVSPPPELMAEGNPFAEPMAPAGFEQPAPTPLPEPEGSDSWGAFDSPVPPPMASPEMASDVAPKQPTIQEPVASPPALNEGGVLPSARAAEAMAPVATEPEPEGFAPPIDEWDDSDDDWFDDEDDEENFIEPFSLVEHLASQNPPDQQEGKRERFVAAEVVRHGEGRLWDVQLVRPGQAYCPGPGQPEILRMGRGGQCTITVPGETDGTIWIGGAETALNARPPSSDGMRKLTLNEGDRALLKSMGSEHLVQVLRPPKATSPSVMWAMLSFLMVTGFAAGVGGALVATLIALGPSLTSDPDPVSSLEEHFEEISQNDLALIAAQVEDVVEVEEEEEEVEEEDETNIQEQEIEPERRPRTIRRRSRATTGGGGSAASRLLQKLRGGGGGRGSGTSLQDVITNIDAVGSPSAASGLFRTTGLFSSLPGGQVKIARRGSGGGGINTIGGGQLAGKGLGRVQGSEGRRGKVRGRVSRVSSQARVRGNLDRGEVLRVINRATGAIQRCYERRLISNPTLSGRLVMAWTINTSGRVAGVSARSSSLSDPAVASCIAGVIRRLRFPQPEGGSVSISFPFLFRAVEF